MENLRLSSDVRDGKPLPGGTTAHADWFGAWHPEAMDQWIKNCNNTGGNDCEIGLLSLDPPISLVEKPRGYYQPGKIVPAVELKKLCPGETLDQANPFISVSHCGHS